MQVDKEESIAVQYFSVNALPKDLSSGKKLSKRYDLNEDKPAYLRQVFDADGDTYCKRSQLKVLFTLG